jgi:hypothetical protein
MLLGRMHGCMLLDRMHAHMLLDRMHTYAGWCQSQLQTDSRSNSILKQVKVIPN